ncbi:MAG: c-type cytochrome [Novosphingobium meiothermophilum]|uniref:c-type cytochrome n=1 Tax=Novosphingobium TaxID=165696 RepID=UPI000D6E1B59|nr:MULTISPECIES: cytochrome c [Novosphingobium]
MNKPSLLLALTAGLASGSITASALAQSAADAAGPGLADVVHSGDADGAFTSPARFGEPDGEKIYRRVCAGCHMADGKGAQGAGFYPALARNQNIASGDYAVYVVVKGLHGMPGVGRMMSDQQVADVVNYVRTHFGNRYKDKVTPAQVSAVR